MKKIWHSPLLVAILATLLFSNTTFAQQATLISYGSQWLFFDNQAQPDNQGSLDWNDTDFNATPANGWESGWAQLGYGGDGEVTEINNANGATITAYFRRAFVANPATITSLEFNLTYDDGAVVYINGTEVLPRVNMPQTGPIDYFTLASGNPGGDPATTTFTIDPIPPGLLQLGTNILAVEVHERANSDDLSFDLELLCFGPLKVERGPYLQLQTPNSMTIRWRTNVATESVVHYGTIQGSLNLNVSNTALTTDHEVTITGLTPSTAYFYDIANSATVLVPGAADLYFRTAPTPGTSQPFSAWILGDCGDAGVDDPDDQQSVRNAYYNMYGGTTGTDMILFLGDNAYNNGTDAEYQSALFENMYEDMLQNTVSYSCIGNHENNISSVPYYDIFTLPRTPTTPNEPMGTEAYYSFDYGDVHFICLDSETNPPGMLQWCTNDLEQTTARWIIAFWHHPPYTKGTHDSDEDGQLIDMREIYLPVLEAHGVDLVLTGHSHIYERSFFLNGHYGNSNSFSLVNHTVGDTGDGDGQIDGDGAYAKDCEADEGAVYVVTGSAGRAGDDTPNEDHEAMFFSIPELGSCRLSINDNQLDLTFLSAENGVLDHFTIMKDCEEVNLCQCPNGTGQHLAADPVNGTNISTLLSGGGNLTNTCISVSGKLIIDNNGVNNATVAWNNVDVIMHPGAEIVVANNTQLSITNFSLVSGCTHMWKGISLGNSNSKLLVDGSEIRDAQYAVTVQNGSRISLFNSTFTANYVGIYAKSSSTLQNFRTIAGSQSTGHWSNNTFQQGLGDLLPPYQGQSPTPGTRSFAGMYLKDVTNISTIFKQGIPNYFNGSRYGIYIDRGTNVSIHGVEISDLSSIVPSNQIGVYMLNSVGINILYSQIGTGVRVGIKGSNAGGVIRANNISALEKGIEIRNVVNKSVVIRLNPNIRASTGIEIKNCQNSLSPTPFLPITITGNSSINAKTGVYIDDTHSVLTMSDNIINMDYNLWGASMYGSRIIGSSGQIRIETNQYNFPNLNSTAAVGIQLQTSENCKLYNNTITGPIGFTNLAKAINVSTSPNNNYCCNTLQNSHTGVFFSGMCNETGLYRTSFNNHQISLDLNSAQIGDQFNNGNNWQLAGSVQWDARFQSENPNEILESEFRVDPILMPNQYTKISVPPTSLPEDWFTFFGTDINCYGCNALNPWEQMMDPNTGLTDNDIKNATALSSTTAIAKGQKWEARQHLYAKLMRHPGLLGLNTTVGNFFSAANNGNIGDFYDIRQGLTAAYQAGISGTNYWTLWQSLEDKSNQINDLWIQWQNAPPTQQPAIEAQIASVEAAYAADANAFTNLENQLEPIRIQAIDALIQNNNAIAVSEVYETNERDINGVFLNTVAKGIYALSSPQMATVDAVAAQCPLSGGSSVYIARGLQALYDEREYNDEQLCDPGLRRLGQAMESFEKSDEVTLYPNPVNGVVHVQFPQILEEDRYFILYDLAGNELHRQYLKAGAVEYEVSVENIPGGLYFFKISHNGRHVLSSGKIVILRM
jgi:Calcineurin-like phosphoesterase/Purple acid Phosphatase, N-terminal domain/Secretion system C-terminal sorting domain/Periplasmic copper-binding protein (NosD)